MEAGLRDKVFLITGAGGGIGTATARELAACGARLVLHYNNSHAKAEALAAELDCSTVQADLRREEGIEAMVATALSRVPRLDGIVVNAGVWENAEVPLWAMSMSQWRNTLDSNLTSAFLTCREFLKHLHDKPRHTASIVFVWSTAGLMGEAGHADYSASKSALIYGLTLSLKNEIIALAPGGRVNCVCPGWTDTPMAEAAMTIPDAQAKALQTVPLAKIAQPEDVARTITFLCSDRLAGHITGAIMPVAGGMEGRVLHDNLR
jgi:3-oxoacyl-[acyl-carrier protein] reductase